MFNKKIFANIIQSLVSHIKKNCKKKQKKNRQGLLAAQIQTEEKLLVKRKEKNFGLDGRTERINS